MKKKKPLEYVPVRTIFPCWSGNGCQWLGQQGRADVSQLPIAWCLKDSLVVGPEIGCKNYTEKKQS